MICIETDSVKRFESSIILYTRFIDGGFCAWHGSDKDFENFASEFNSADSSIKVSWSSLSKASIFLDDSNQSSLSQLVTRYTRHGRFIRRHLFGPRPITQCQTVLGLPDCMASMGAGNHVPPHTFAYAGPNRVDAGGERKSRPPRTSKAATVTARSPAASQRAPRGPRARRTKRGSRDNADRARLGPAAGS